MTIVIPLILIVVVVFGYKMFSGVAPGSKLIVEDPPIQNNQDPNQATFMFFYTTWCPHCISAKPEWKAFVEENKDKVFNGKRVNFVDVDCDKEPALADKYDVSGYPTIKLDKGSEIIEFKSKPTKSTLMEFLSSV